MDKRWFEQYQNGVPHEIDASQYLSLISLFTESCNSYASRAAYSNLGTEITYAELDSLSRNFAAYLQQLNLEKGARVAIMLPNVLQYPVAIFGVLRAGYVVVNTNPLYTADEVIHQMNDSGAEVIIVLANFAKTIEKALPSMPSVKHVIVTQLGDLFPSFKRFIVNFVVNHIKKLVPAFTIPRAVAFNYALSEGKQAPLHRVELNHDDIAFLQYTGGTTGVAKGAILTHGNLIANVMQAYTWISPLGVSDQDVIVTALPLYHIFSLTANCLTFMKIGAKNILITNPRDMGHFIDQIKNSGFTAITGVNTLFNGLLNHPKFKEVDFSKLKLALSGGMALQKSVSLKWSEMTKTRVLEAYGLTETSPAVTINPMYLEGYNGSIGLPLPSTDVSIRDESGKEVPIGTSGELCIKGPQVMPGYWKRPDETALVFTKDGFLKTGDIARMDEEGFIYLVDRKKDMIVVSGFNVYPNEVEQIIGMHPGVLEVGVVGIVDEESGERVKACIVRKDSTLTAEQIINHCKEHLTAYKIPKVVEFFDELPKTNVGKILRRALKDQENEQKCSVNKKTMEPV
ncbi:TPA: AMP-binding protein [Legionella pneumophila subsp. pneumophila]|uniref:AMP-binding protein n=1 Tax=Legionella sp. PATHC039 TaxID=2992042 RepID=UPI001A32BBFE|nr:AMP-binding protein [Legionella sp. PATHC039]MCW8394974.1 AMP-binding protein [Legionella sp. PATHC039]HAT8858718.1 AMP-binding protein [Legionella pneumophila subsp. pneumophila]HAT9650851.1 AMP-binding protein [Legionella pneumophila subsp. pneumophila]HAT9920520.1 AMP-binding protein [Legionella pneumophila subsp. pneumophila]